ncbi:hypothetical protein KCP73_12405 [Salmonella enterica subsp. enterica]|nr:hypothetical protein KCP73_12405 [Salmonella enterica subsp. enterica]
MSWAGVRGSCNFAVAGTPEICAHVFEAVCDAEDVLGVVLKRRRYASDRKITK